MKTKLVLAAFLVASASTAMAATISVDLFTDTIARTSAGVLLDDTFSARVGVYNGPALTASSVAADILTGWRQIGSTQFGTGPAVGYNGYFNTGGLDFTNAGGFAGAQVWVWLTDGGGNNALITGFQTAYLDDSAIPNSNALSLTQANVSTATFALGSYNPTGESTFGGGTIVLNNAIPEPSAVLLGALGALGLLRRRRN